MYLKYYLLKENNVIVDNVVGPIIFGRIDFYVGIKKSEIYQF